jgi:dTDP-4-amino-4,6-dideoxygalactose transaminase
VGLNGKLSEVHAAIGLALFERVDEEIERRTQLVQRYRTALAGVPGVRFQRLVQGTRPNSGYFPIEVDEELFGLDRNALFRALRAENVYARKYFYPLCSENESYRELPSAQPERLPHARRLASRILCLPLFGEMPECDVDRICELILRIQREAEPIRAALG